MERMAQVGWSLARATAYPDVRQVSFPLESLFDVTDQGSSCTLTGGRAPAPSSDG
jgi:hypothetical protein